MTHCTETTKQVARKPHRCTWCWQTIPVGEEYSRYRHYGDDVGTVKLHHECYEAMQEVAKEEGGYVEWTPGMERPVRKA